MPHECKRVLSVKQTLPDVHCFGESKSRDIALTVFLRGNGGLNPARRWNVVLPSNSLFSKCFVRPSVRPRNKEKAILVRILHGYETTAPTFVCWWMYFDASLP